MDIVIDLWRSMWYWTSFVIPQFCNTFLQLNLDLRFELNMFSKWQRYTLLLFVCLGAGGSWLGGHRHVCDHTCSFSTSTFEGSHKIENKTVFELNNLEAYTEYTVRVQATNNAGGSPLSAFSLPVRTNTDGKCILHSTFNKYINVVINLFEGPVTLATATTKDHSRPRNPPSPETSSDQSFLKLKIDRGHLRSLKTIVRQSHDHQRPHVGTGCRR
jgi:hypothetical protein